MKGKRTDVETKATVIEHLINGKLGSDIARETGVHESTISRIKDNDLQEVARESKAIALLIDRNNTLQSAGDALIAEMIADKADGITIAQLTTLRQSTFTQNQILTGKPTERIAIDDLSGLTLKELEQERNKLL